MIWVRPPNLKKITGKNRTYKECVMTPTTRSTPDTFEQVHGTLARAHRISKPVAGILTAVAASAVAIATITTVRMCEHREPPTLSQHVAHAGKRAALLGTALYLKHGRCTDTLSTNGYFVDLRNQLGNGRGCGAAGETPQIKNCYHVMASVTGFEKYRGCAQAVDELLATATR